MNCLICHKELIKFGVAEDYSIYRCPNCGFGQTENLKAQKGAYHRDETYIDEELLFKNIFQKRVDKLLLFKNKGRALEVGCSTGLMLSLLSRKGWEVLGIEISKEAIMIAKERGIDVIEDKFEKTKFNGTFDLIIFNHTLEHLENPKETLKKAISYLNNNGLLYIDLPNFGGLSAKIQKGNWPHLLPNEHLWHFSEKSLEILINSLGLKIVFIEKASGIWDYGNPIAGIFISLLNLKKRFFKEVLTSIPSFLITKIGVGSDLMIIARKN